MDRERNRTPLEELRQVAEDALEYHAVDDRVQLRSTSCLGGCSRGHIMGLADEEQGLVLFNQMNSEEPVRDLVELARRQQTSGSTERPDSLEQRFEGSLGPESIPQIPYREQGSPSEN